VIRWWHEEKRDTARRRYLYCGTQALHVSAFFEVRSQSAVPARWHQAGTAIISSYLSLIPHNHGHLLFGDNSR
jgi:hypothetical protein